MPQIPLLESPFNLYSHEPEQTRLANERKKEQIAQHFAAILKILGLDLNDPSLEKTPERVAKMYVEELFCGLNPNNYPEITTFDFQDCKDQKSMVLVQNITVQSICEHHFVPMIGTAAVAYFPKNKILGLSKVHRIVDFLSKQPQLQEKLTSQIVHHLAIWTGSEDIAICMKLKHHCISLRGIKDVASETQTSLMKGLFLTNPDLRQDFYRQMQI
jgi:GTP cyclohydrolase IA